MTSVSEKRLVFRGEGAAVSLPTPRLATETPFRRVFLLSPANASGIRAAALFGGSCRSELARQLKATGAPLGQIFSFMSSLYFRGKLAYAAAFSCAPSNLPGAVIITPARGLLLPETIMTVTDLRDMSVARVKHTNQAYREPLERDARLLADELGPDERVILLGSVATPKYVEPLLSIFGDRLMFPADFAGRGNMSRGKLLLHCCRRRTELTYIPVLGVVASNRAPAARPRKAPGHDRSVVTARRKQTHK